MFFIFICEVLWATVSNLSNLCLHLVR